LNRPIENTLPAFDQAWLAGFNLCECDIAGSTDHHLVLAHDINLKRISLQPHEEQAMKAVEEMDIANIMALSLKSGVRVPLLQEVLQSACFIPDARLVIEIKPSIADVPTMLCQLFLKRPDFVPKTAVIMSFDLYLIHTMKQKYDELVRIEMEANSAIAFDFDSQHPKSIEHPKFLWLSLDAKREENIKMAAERASGGGNMHDDACQLIDIEDMEMIIGFIKTLTLTLTRIRGHG